MGTQGKQGKLGYRGIRWEWLEVLQACSMVAFGWRLATIVTGSQQWWTYEVRGGWRMDQCPVLSVTVSCEMSLYIVGMDVAHLCRLWIRHGRY